MLNALPHPPAQELRSLISMQVERGGRHQRATLLTFSCGNQQSGTLPSAVQTPLQCKDPPVRRYAEFCALTANKMGVPPLQHPIAVPLGPGERLKIGYVSSDFGNHPLSHLMASVFGSHDRSKVSLCISCCASA